ncbi:PEP-CTERM sorting domain-containing protein [Accumulibacter sp.]|nr:PEP-CTERM sorting domain-containing protein [Accumulibacter sp.]HRF04220.1 PEP-CTERM sorting domain-containing protein [Accumulibacter sp.]
MKKLAFTLLGALLAFATTVAQAIPLSDLFNGDTLQVEDKLFSDWRLNGFVDPLDAPPIDLDLIEVTGISGDPLNPGLNFAIGGGGLQAGGASFEDYLELWFEFKLTVLDPGMRIKDNELNFFNGWFASADSFLLINETVCTSANCVPTNPDMLAYKEVLVDLFPGQPDIIVEQDIQNFLPQQAIWVAKFIAVETYDGSPAGITNFQQFFSQEVVSVPEPDTWAMIALGLIGAGFARRRLGCPVKVA